MATKHSPSDVAGEMLAELASDGRDSRRMRSKTFWRAFGVSRRTPASIERVATALASHGLVASTKGGEFGAEDQDDWITIIVLATPERRPAPAPPGETPPLRPRASDVPSRVPESVLPAASSVPGPRVGPAPASAPEAARTMEPSVWESARRLAANNPVDTAAIVIGLLALALTGSAAAFVAIGVLWWAARSRWRRVPSLGGAIGRLDDALGVGGTQRSALLFTGGVVATLMLVSNVMQYEQGSPPRAASTMVPAPPAAAERAVPTATAAAPAIAPPSASSTPIVAPSASETPMAAPTATSVPATETAAPPPTITPTSPPPTALPPIDIDPEQRQECDSFPNYDTMKAWRDYWQARGIGNPGGLDGNGNGLACEAGEGGRRVYPTRRPTTTPTPPPAPIPLFQAPAPPPPSGGGGGGCCRYCTARSQPCGNSCISLDKTCHKGPGCACRGG